LLRVVQYFVNLTNHRSSL